MELVSRTDDDLTISMSRRNEFSFIMAAFAAAIEDYDRLDLEVMGVSRDRLREVERSLRRMTDTSLPSTGG